MLMMQKHKAMIRLSYNIITPSSFAYSDNFNNLLHIDLWRSMAFTATHTHFQTQTKLQDTGTCFSHQTGLFQVLYIPRLHESKAVAPSATAPHDTGAFICAARACAQRSALVLPQLRGKELVLLLSNLCKLLPRLLQLPLLSQHLLLCCDDLRRTGEADR